MGIQTRSVGYGDKKNSLHLPEIEPRSLGSLARSLAMILMCSKSLSTKTQYACDDINRGVVIETGSYLKKENRQLHLLPKNIH